ncbi:MAG: Grx4 family monothiol glutaredoxin [Deltaproteobacteria bacterium]|nr:Grx4 family monothiol glutaredoxin [Deltaproteobacteria bacterium]
MSLDSATRQRIEEMIASNDVVLFMKGNRDAPQCGFSSTVIGILDGLVADYATTDVLADSAVREGIKEYSQWPTVPQLYVRGEFLGGCDIVQELAASGELAKSLGVSASAPSEPPEITVTPAGAEALRAAARTAPDDAVLHLGIDARFQNKLYFAPRGANEISVESNGIEIALDPVSVGRANGSIIDVVETEQGPGFRIDNPNAPAGQVNQASVGEIKQQLDAGELREFFDVRTPEERAKASIPGTRLMTPEEAERIGGLPKDTALAFHCHHGGRSQAAAEHFAGLGFVNVSNVVGGIDAWSLEIDPEVPRY